MRMKNLNKWNNDFFSVFILAIIALANIGSAIVHGLENDWPSVAFNVLIALFSIAVVVHLIRNF